METGLGQSAFVGKGSVVFLGEKPCLAMGLGALEWGEGLWEEGEEGNGEKAACSWPSVAGPRGLWYCKCHGMKVVFGHCVAWALEL